MTMDEIMRDSDLRYAFEERVAIRIYDARMSEKEALKLTKHDMGVTDEAEDGKA